MACEPSDSTIRVARCSSRLPKHGATRRLGRADRVTAGSRDECSVSPELAVDRLKMRVQLSNLPEWAVTPGTHVAVRRDRRALGCVHQIVLRSADYRNSCHSARTTRLLSMDVPRDTISARMVVPGRSCLATADAATAPVNVPGAKTREPSGR
jgi:hypothetical protein